MSVDDDYGDDTDLNGDEEREIVLTRRELYDLVWSQAVWVLAKRYGLSDRGFAKICGRHHVPVPPRGYWTRKQYGKKVTQPPLPSLPGRDSTTIRLQIAQTKATPKNIEPEIAFEREAANKIIVDPSVRLAHPLVLEAQAAFKSASADERGICHRVPKVLNLHVSETARPRALRILQVLITSLEARGHTVGVQTERHERPGEYPYPRIDLVSKTTVNMFGEHVEFEIEERAKRVPKGTGLKIHNKPGTYRRNYPYDFVPNGRLSFEIHSWTSGRRRWSDGRHTLDLLLNEIIVGLLEAAFAARQAKIAAEQQRQEQAKRAARAEEERKSHEAEAARITLVRQQMRALLESREIRRYVRTIRRSGQKAGRTLDQESELGLWLAWMEAYAESIDPVNPLLAGAKIAGVGRDAFEANQPGFAPGQLSAPGAIPRGWPYTPWYRR